MSEAMNIFETAARKKIRFAYKGSLSTEDLWDLTMKDLDTLYKSLRAAQKEQEGDSLMDRPASNTETNLRVELVKYIFTAKQAEADAKAARLKKADEKRRILEVLAKKQDAQLEGRSIEELQKMLDE